MQFGKEILKIVPGKVSTEVDAAYSFDTKASVEKALKIIDVRMRGTVGSLAVMLTDAPTVVQGRGN